MFELYPREEREEREERPAKWSLLDLDESAAAPPEVPEKDLFDIERKSDRVFPIERAILGFIQPKLLTTEREFLEKNQFQVAYRPYDWSLNDLTGREWIAETKNVWFQKGLGAKHPEAQIERQHPAPYSFQDVARLRS